ncbi:MAG: hypothetical protein B6245_23520 [Desulfobacteraceae bacterium 4572_88]|nr:MAG: hypothetical protein B6245_23520 [Desulfobacteraceae bacterium 4572_88]
MQGQCRKIFFLAPINSCYIVHRHKLRFSFSAPLRLCASARNKNRGRLISDGGGRKKAQFVPILGIYSW